MEYCGEIWFERNQRIQRNRRNKDDELYSLDEILWSTIDKWKEIWYGFEYWIEYNIIATWWNIMVKLD